MTARNDVEAWSKRWMERAELCKRMASAWPDYARLAAMPSTELDGYGAGGGGGGRAKGTHADPVLALIERKEGCPVDERGEPKPIRIAPDEWRDAAEDRVAHNVELLFATAQRAEDALRQLAALARLIDNRADGRSGRQSSVKDCQCCEATVTGIGEDRIVTGYCPPCKQAWMRYRDREIEAGRDPDHEMFRIWRRRELAQRSERAS